MFLFLTVIQAIIAAALVGVVLMQRSEGGGLGIGSGGSPGGLMSARGAADFLTRTTKWLAVLFVGLAIVIGGVAVNTTSGGEFDTSLDRTVAPANPDGGLNAPVVDTPAPTGTATASPQGNDPLAGVAQ
ncbi:MAG: preprotein translocase subunit SecG [Altererythrobacter sp.]|nr:preprotein translocase subunit SecG [Altererythrobacter sp.]OJU58891.1 MAG: preprotein translocase subunit SecG [Altererythrobacter sp. 66-12]